MQELEIGQPQVDGQPNPTLDPHTIETAKSRRERYREWLISRQRGRSVRLKDFLLAKKRHFRMVDAEARRKHLQQIDMMLRYFVGDMFGGYNSAGVYKDERAEGDFAYAIPVMTGHVGEAFMQIMKVNPAYTVAANNKSDDSQNRFAHMCEELGTEEKDRLMTEDKRQTEILNFILAGDSHREIFWSPDSKSPRKAKRLDYKRVEMELPGRRECAQCKVDIPEGESKCPACGVSLIREIPPAAAHRDEPQEIEVELGQNNLRIPHPMAVQTDLDALEFDHSTYLIEHDYLDKHVAASSYETTLSDTEMGLSPEMQARHDLARNTVQMDGIVGSTRAYLKGGSTNKIERERHFWDVHQYGQFWCEVEETLPDGSKIPAGTFLGDHFPKGMYVMYVGDDIIDVQAAEKRRRWTKVTYGKRPGSSVGLGAKLLAMLNDIVNDDYGQVHQAKRTIANPLLAVMGTSVKLIPELGNYLRVDKFAPGQSIRDVLAHFPGAMPAGMDATSTQIQQMMQFIMGTYTLGAGGAPDMANFGGTATEVTARTEQASGRQIGPIGQIIAADKELILQALENIRDYSSPEQRAELEKRFGVDICEIFFGPKGTKGKGANFRQLLTVGIKPNTDIPRSMARTQAGMIAFAQSAGQLMQFAQEAPWVMEFLGAMADSWGISLNIGPGRNDRREAEKRLNKLTAIEEKILAKQPELAKNPEAVAELMYLALSEFCAPLIAQAEPEMPELPPEVVERLETLPPEQQEMARQQLMERAYAEAEKRDAPRVFLQDHEAFKDAYKDELFSEKAEAYSPARKIVIIRLWMDHYNAQNKQQALMAELQSELQQTLAPPPPPEKPEPSPEDEEQRALKEKAIDHEVQEESKDNDLQRKMAEKRHATDEQIRAKAAESEMQPHPSQAGR